MAKNETEARVEAASAAFDATKAPQRPSRGSTVTVACKMPGGMLLRLFNMVPRVEQVMGGGMRSFEIAEQIGPMVKINGYAVPFGVEREHAVAGGYALTEGVDAEFMERWLEQNQDLDAVKNGLIIVHEKSSMVSGQAKEQATIRSGLEPLNMDDKRGKSYVDPRVPRNVEKMNKEPA